MKGNIEMELLPKPPSSAILKSLRRYRVDIACGEVFGRRYPHSLGSTGDNGRIYIDIYAPGERRNIMRYHIVWWAATGQWPTQEIDHVDGDFTNDAFSNLEMVTREENVRRYNERRKHEYT